MAVRIPSYEPHVQLDSGAHTIPRVHGGGEIGAAISKAGDSLIALGAHYQRKQEQFENMQFTQRMNRAKADADAVVAEETANYDPRRDTPGTLHNKIMTRVQAIYANVYQQTPERMQPQAREIIATNANTYSHNAATQENDKIRGAATQDLDQIAANWRQVVKQDPSQAPNALKAMNAAVNGYSGSFSDGQRAVKAKAYSDQIAKDAISGYVAKGDYDGAKNFATEYSKQRDQTFGPGFRAGGAQPQDGGGAGGTLDKQSFDRTFKGTPLEGQYDKVVQEANKNGVPPALLAAVMAHETDKGRSRMLAERNNPAGLMDPNNTKQGMRFDTVEQGIEQAGRSVAKNYQQGGGTIAGMQKTYAPIGAENDPRGQNADWTSGVTRYANMFGGTPAVATDRGAPTGDSAQKFAGSGEIHEPIANSTGIGGKVGDDSASRGRGAHQGNDIMAPVGTSVMAVKDGTVERLSKDNFGKDVIVLRFNDGTYARYMHMSSVGVKVGDTVKGGEEIGKSGSANGVAHLHFEAWNQAPNRGNVGLVEPSQVFGWNKTKLPGGATITAGGAAPAEGEPRRTATVVDTEGKKVVVDPETGKMVRAADMPVRLPGQVASAGPIVGGMGGAPEPVDPSKYETKLSPEEEKKFQEWKAKNAPNDSGQDYDLRGAFKAGVKPDAETGHWPDTYKKPNHPTFSDQSQYAGDRPDLAGRWEGDKFIPPQSATPDERPQAVIPLPQPRPVLRTEGGSFLESSLAAIEAAQLKSTSINSAMKRSLTDTLNSDITSRLNTGVPVKLTPDLQKYYGTNELSYEFIANKLGEGEAIKWEQAKGRADRFYSAGANMKEMPEQQIYERLRALAPKEGSPDYVQQLDVYNHALKEKDKVLAEREKDPALAVQNLSGVKAAYEAYLKDPSVENGQKLAAARMEGQRYLGIGEDIRTPLTNAEGSRIAKGFSGKGSLNPAATAAGAVTRLQQMLGGNEDYMTRALATVGRQQGVNEQAAAQLSVAWTEAQKKPADSITPTGAPTNAKPTAPKSLFPTDPTAYDDFGRPIVQSQPAGGPDPGATIEDVFTPDRLVPAERIKNLLRNPAGESAKFDQEFGSGATAHYIQKQHDLGLLPPVVQPEPQAPAAPVSPDQSLQPPTPEEDKPKPTPEEEESTGSPF